MKKNFLIVLSFFLALPSFLLAGDNIVEVNGLMYRLGTETSTAAVTYKGESWIFLQSNYKGDIVIPESIDYDGKSYKVNTIGEGAFYYCSDIQSISIPRSVEKIEDYAFAGCEGIKAISIPEAVSSLGEESFSGCRNLTSIILPRKIGRLPSYCFQNCVNLISVDMQSDTIRIEKGAFFNCSKLSEINFPKILKTLGDFAFSKCNDLISVNLPEGLTKIGTKAFEGCANLAKVSIPEGVRSLGMGVFWNCPLLTQVIFPKSLITMEKFVFTNCRSLKSIIIPNGVEKILADAFNGCSSLSSVSLPSSLVEIGPRAFAYCSLSDILIPGSVKTIGVEAFRNNYYLSTISLSEGLISIGDVAFYGCPNLKSIKLPKSLESIGTIAFNECKLENILALNSRVKGSAAFSDKTYNHAILYVPKGEWSESVYDGDLYRFMHICEMTTSTRDVTASQSYYMMDAKSFDYVLCDTEAIRFEPSSITIFDEENSYSKWQIRAKDNLYSIYNDATKNYLKIGDNVAFVMSEEPFYMSLKDGDCGVSLPSSDNNWIFIETLNNTSGQKTTSIEKPCLTPSTCDYYTPNGRHYSYPQKGMNIVRDAQGHVYKQFNR